MSCARCGDTEDRINGYCSIYCQDMGELDDIISRLEATLAAIRALAVDRDGFATAESLGALVDEIAELAGGEGDE